MKGLIWIIVLFAAAVGLTIAAQHYSGNVYIVIDQTQTGSLRPRASSAGSGFRRSQGD